MSLGVAQTNFSGVSAPITLWILDHEFRYISEQVEFLCSSMAKHGYVVRVSRRPNPRTLNVVIEGFSSHTAAAVSEFCRVNRKRVAVLLTEHLDFVGGRVFFHGVEINSRDDYIRPDSKLQRFIALVTLRECVRGFLRLGDLPRLHGLHEMIPDVEVLSIPYPVMRTADRSLRQLRSPVGKRFDFVFTGVLTTYRQRVLSGLSRDFNVYVGREAVSRRRRDALNATGRLVLNIPQNERWSWISMMRVLAALRCRRATLAIGDFEPTLADSFCVRLTPQAVEDAVLHDFLGRSEEVFHQCLAAYEGLVNSERNPPFPHRFLELWAQLEL